MATIDTNWLSECGIPVDELPEEDVQTLLARANSELELRVGDTLSQNLTDEQISAFETVLAGDGDTVAWLEENYPGYPRVVETQFQGLTEEIKNSPHKVTLIMSWKES